MKNSNKVRSSKKDSTSTVSLEEFKQIFVSLQKESTRQILEQLVQLRQELSEKPTRIEFENFKKIQAFQPRQSRSLSVIKIGLN